MADVSIPTGAPFEGHPTTLTVTTFAQTLLDDADAAAVRSTIGAGTSSFSGAFGDLTGKPTTLSGYGIADATPGVYAPTRSAEANTDANVTMSEAQYMRVGTTVTVSGRFTINPTLAATVTSFEFTLPVASNIGAVEDLAGVAFCGAIAGLGAAITGSVANNTAVVSFISSDLTEQTWSFTLTYQVI